MKIKEFFEKNMGCLTFLIIAIMCIVSIVKLNESFKEVNVVYEDIENIDATNTTEKVIARIYIKDSYVMGGENYYIFTTSETGKKEFTLSETEYDQYIGIGNDAVEGYEYKFVLESKLLYLPYNTNYWYNRHKHTCGYVMADFTGGVNEEGMTILAVDYSDYNTNLYGITIKPKYKYEGKNNALIMSESTMYRYSFLGEKAFTDEEIVTYKENFNDDNLQIIELFKEEYN